MEKKRWATPELIVLLRSNPEEAVLETCKYSSNPTGPVTGNVGCNNEICEDCIAYSAS